MQILVVCLKGLLGAFPVLHPGTVQSTAASAPETVAQWRCWLAGRHGWYAGTLVCCGVGGGACMVHTYDTVHAFLLHTRVLPTTFPLTLHTIRSVAVRWLHYRSTWLNTKTLPFA